MLAQSRVGGWLLPGFTVFEFGIVRRRLPEERLLPSREFRFRRGTVELPQGGAFADSQAMRDRLVTAAEAIKTDYNSQPRYQQTPAIDNILGVAGGIKSTCWFKQSTMISIRKK